VKLHGYQIVLIAIGLFPMSFLNAQTLSKTDEMSTPTIVSAVPEDDRGSGKVSGRRWIRIGKRSAEAVGGVAERSFRCHVR
jgi:hypothetical protein